MEGFSSVILEHRDIQVIDRKENNEFKFVVLVLDFGESNVGFRLL